MAKLNSKNEIYILDLRWNAELPKNLGKTYDKIAHSIRKEFNLFIENISKSLSDNLDWWIEGPASRNIFSSPLFHYCCAIALLEHLDFQKNFPKLIIVDSKEFHNMINEWFTKKNIRTEIRQLPKINESIFKKKFGGILRPVKSSLKVLQLYLITRNKSSVKKFNIANKPIILIDTPISDGCEKNDRCFVGLWENLEQEKRNRTFFVPEFEKASISGMHSAICNLKNSNKNYLFKWEYLGLKDYIFAIKHYFRIRKIKLSGCLFRDLSFDNLIFEELSNGLNFGMAIKAILNYRFFQKLSEIGIRIETSINWFENQGMDKGWNRGLNEFFPTTKKNGYLGMIISQHYLPMFPTKAEENAGVLPDKLFVLGEGLKAPLKEFNRDLKVLTAPAFRFQGVYRDSSKKKKTEGLTILIALYSLIKEAQITLKLALETSKLFNNDISIKWKIKPHPLLEKKKLISNLDYTLPEDWEWSEGDFHDCLDDVDVMMGNASSTCMEALARGRFVLLVGNLHGLTQNPIPDSIPKKLWKICYTHNDTAKALEQFSKINISKVNSTSIKDNYFAPLTKDNLDNLI